ncbi:hypothetical protein ACVWW1_008306 [Bradyrhizobium sp. JR3.5]
MPNFGRLRVGVELELRDQLLGQRAARALREQRVLAEQLHAAGVGILVAAVLGDAHVAGRDAAHRALVVIEHLGGGEARIDLDAERFRLWCEPAADIAERADIVVMIVHQRRHDEVRNAEPALRRRPVEAVFLDLRLQRTVRVLAPVRDQFVERHRIDHRTRQDVRADLGALLHHDDRELGIELLQPDRGRQARRAGADDDDIEFHRLARGKVFSTHDLDLSPLRTLLSFSKVVVSDFWRKDNHGIALPWLCTARIPQRIIFSEIEPPLFSSML